MSSEVEANVHKWFGLPVGLKQTAWVTANQGSNAAIEGPLQGQKLPLSQWPVEAFYLTILDWTLLSGKQYPDYSDADYEWAAKAAVTPQPANRNAKSVPASKSLGEMWSKILSDMFLQMSDLPLNQLSRNQVNFFLMFYGYAQKFNSQTGAISFQSAGIDKNKLNKKYIDIMVTRKDGTGITKLVAELSVNGFEKEVREKVSSLLQSPVEISSPNLIMGAKSFAGAQAQKGLWDKAIGLAKSAATGAVTGGAVGAVKGVAAEALGQTADTGIKAISANGYAVIPIDIKFRAKKYSSWENIKSQFGFSKSNENRNFRDPNNYDDTTGTPIFNDRVWGDVNKESTKVAVSEDYEVALKTGLAQEGLGQFFLQKPSIKEWKKGKSVGQKHATYTWKAPNGLGPVKDLRDLGEKGTAKYLYDGMEAQLNASYVQLIEDYDWETIDYQTARAGGGDLSKYHSGLTQGGKRKKWVNHAANAIARLFASGRQREYMEEYFKKISSDITDLLRKAATGDKAALAKLQNQEQLGKDAMKDAKAAADKRLEDGIASATKAENRIETLEVDRLTEDEVNAKRKYVKQCALTLNYPILKEKYESKRKKQRASRQSPHKDGHFDNRFYMIDCMKARRIDIVNQLISPKHADIAPFMRLTPDLVSALTPKIRLYKVWEDSAKNLVQQEIPFRNFEDPSRIKALRNLTSEADRGNGAGIKSFKYTFEGTNPAEARSAIGAEMVLFFQSFGDLTKKRKGGDRSWSYIDLIMRPYDPESKAVLEQGTHNPYEDGHSANWRVRVDLGWNDLSGRQRELFNRPDLGITADNIQKAIDRINKSYYLVMVDHEFDLKENGNIEIKANYRAYAETALQDKRIDALSTPSIIEHRANFGKELRKLMKDGKCTADEYKELLATYQSIDEEFRLASYRSIMKRMLSRGHVHYCKLTRQEGGKFKTRGGRIFESKPELQFGANGGLGTVSYTSDDSAVKKAESKVKSEDKAKKDLDKNKGSASNTDDGKGLDDSRTFTQLPSLEDKEDMVSFFYMGDLLHTLLDCMYKPKSSASSETDISELDMEVGKKLPHLQNINIALTSFDYVDEYSGKGKNDILGMNFAEIPVATDYFFEFMTEKVIKGERKSYPVLDMIRDLSREAVTDILSEQCADLKEVKKLDFKHMVYVGASKSNGKDPLRELVSSDSFIYSDTNYKKGKLPIQGVKSNMHVKDFQNYIVLFPNYHANHYDGFGNRKDDEEAGVYHFEIGGRTGLLKKIKFAKVDNKYNREARFFEQGTDGLLQLGAVYKATIDMVGNNLYYPGMNLWIEPTSLGSGVEMDPRKGPTSGKRGSVANALGFGGYHNISRVNGFIGPGKFTTSVEAQWFYSGDGGKQYLEGKVSGADSTTGTPEKEKKEDGSPADKDRLGNKGDKKATSSGTSCSVYIKKRQLQLQDIYEKQSTGLDSVSLAGPQPVITVTATTGGGSTSTGVSEPKKKITDETNIKIAKETGIEYKDYTEEKYVFGSKNGDEPMWHWPKFYTDDGNYFDSQRLMIMLEPPTPDKPEPEWDTIDENQR